MFDTDNETQERGQVGIGTLIVFIALVLVAAIAAGVLINTAGFLQSQAEATGEESTSQVSDNVQVVGLTGEVDSASEVTDISVTVSKAPGSDAIDLSSLTIQVLTDDGDTLLTDGDYTIEDVEGAGNDILSDASDRASIEIDMQAQLAPLEAGDTAELTITTAQGSQTIAVATVPDPLTDDDADGAVNL